MKRREIVVCIILSLVTCGIYQLYWMAKIADDTNYVAQEPNGTSGGTVVLLTIITCGIYGLYWFYKQGEKLNRAKAMRGLSYDNSISIIYLLLGIFTSGIGTIINLCLMQNDLNNMNDNISNTNY